MKIKYFLLMLIFIFNSCSTAISSRYMINYQNKEEDTPIKEYKIKEDKIYKRNYSNMFPMYRYIAEGVSKDTFSRILAYIGCSIGGLGIPIAIDVVTTPFVFIYDALNVTKTYSYDTNISIDCRLVDINNKPMKNRKLFLKVPDLYDDLKQISSNDKGYINFSIQKNITADEKTNFSKEIDFIFSLNKKSYSYPTKISYTYPFEQGTRYFLNEQKIEKVSAIKNVGNVIVVDDYYNQNK